MAKTPEWLAARIRDYYATTTEDSYLAHWSGGELSLHLGLARETDPGGRDAAMARANAYLADRARVRPGSRVLDAGCGVGGSALWLARERGARVTGITLSPRQVELACGFAAAQGLADRATFEVRDFAETGFGEGTFDVVWNLESLSHAHDPRGYLAHVHALLAPGGRFVCMDPFRGTTGDPSQTRRMCEGMVLPSLRTVDELVAILVELGFTDVEAVDLRDDVLLPARAARAAAQNGALRLRLERELLGTEAPAYEAHLDAAIATADGIESGSVVYAYVGATRP